MEEYAGRILAGRYRLPLPPSDEYELVETRAFDTRSGQEVLVRQVPLPEVVDAELVDGPLAVPAARRAPADPLEPGGPFDPVVDDVPQAGQDAAGCQDPGDLGSCDGHVEPVHGVAGQHGVDGGVRQGYRLGATPQGAYGRQRAAEFGQHARVGLDGDDVRARGDQHAGQLAGSGAEVEHARPGRPLQRPPHRGVRVVRAVLGVGGRGRPERRAEQHLFVMVHPTSLRTPRVETKATTERASAIIARPWLEVVLDGRIVVRALAW